MKLKTQFSLFLAGIFLIPVCLILIIYLIITMNSISISSIPAYSEIFKNESNAFSINTTTWKKVRQQLANKPAKMQYAIFGCNFNVIYSTMKEFNKDKIYRQDEIFGLIENIQSDQRFRLEFISEAQTENEKGVWILTKIPRKYEQTKTFFHDPFFDTLLSALSVMLIFCLSMILVIANSITDSIMYLDGYTKKIAAGEKEAFKDGIEKKDKKTAIKMPDSNEIISLVSSINKMNERLKENEMRRMRFIMGLSHDLRTPIALIKGYAEALDDKMIEDESLRHKSLEIIKNKSETLNDRIDELIDFAKLSTNDWKQNLEEHSLSDFLKDFASRFEIDAQLLHKTVETKIEIPEELRVTFDASLMTRVLENLTGNACRYTKTNGKIKIHACLARDENGKRIEIAISDNGIGIKKEDLPFVFDALYRGTNSRREEGKGLGLSVVKSIVENHGWKIKAESDGENRGSKFTIVIAL